MLRIDAVKVRKAEDIFPVVKECIDKGKMVRITVTGNSMYPFLRDSIDSVELIHVDFKQLRWGDIILVRHKDGQYILHRIIRKKKKVIYTNGDAQRHLEGPFYENQVIGKVIRVWRRDKMITCTNLLWKVLSFLWFLLTPLRRKIIRVYVRRIRKIVRELRSFYSEEVT